MTKAICAIDECESNVHGHGLCNTHYRKWIRSGSATLGKSLDPRNVSKRFWAKVAEGDDGCWIWTASTARSGYGAFRVRGRGTVLAHRFAYEDMRAEIPEGLQLDHLCRVPACVNPDHLEPVTCAVNLARNESPVSVTRRTGVCQRGHQITYDSTGHGRCVECHRTAQRNRLTRRKKEQASA